MKAAQITDYGEVSNIEVIAVDKPTVSEGKVLVAVHAASLNPFDSSVLAGYVKDMMPPLPITLGGDIAGVVVEVGAGVDDLAVGDRVFGQAAAIAGNSGAFAEYAATKASQLAIAPKNLDFNDSASLPLVGVSALQGLVDHINLQAGQKLFIHGGAGAIGSVAIQIAKNIGAYVATTASGDGTALAKKLGADEVIDYKSQDFTEILHDYDAVFDTVGGDDLNKTLAVLKRGGIAVSMKGKADEAKAEELGVTTIGESTHVTTEVLNALRVLVEAGKVVPGVGKVFPLDDVQAAFTTRQTGAVKGKVVLEIKT